MEQQIIFAPFLATHWPHVALVFSTLDDLHAHADSY